MKSAGVWLEKLVCLKGLKWMDKVLQLDKLGHLDPQYKCKCWDIPREELTAQENFSKRMKYYPVNMQRPCWKMSPSWFRVQHTVLDPGHTITSRSADQMIQFVRAVGLGVTWSPDELWEDLLTCCCLQEALAVWGFLHSLAICVSIVFSDPRWVIVWLVSQGIRCQQFRVLRPWLRVKILSRQLASSYLLLPVRVQGRYQWWSSTLSQMKTMCYRLLCPGSCVQSREWKMICLSSRKCGVRIQFLVAEEMTVDRS